MHTHVHARTVFQLHMWPQCVHLIAMDTEQVPLCGSAAAMDIKSNPIKTPGEGERGRASEGGWENCRAHPDD